MNISEEEYYSTVFVALKHPIRRKILRMLNEKPRSFSEILAELKIESAHLTYHLETLRELLHKDENGKYALSFVGEAAVSMMYRVEEVPKPSRFPRLMSKLKRREIKYGLAFTLVAILILAMYSGISINNSLQAYLKRNGAGSVYAAENFSLSISRATSVVYLLLHYREGYKGVYEPNADNIEALSEGFFYEVEHSWDFLRILESLNPDLSEYNKPLYIIDELIFFTIIGWEAYRGNYTVRSVLVDLLNQAYQFQNYSIPINAFKELSQTSFQKIDKMANEVVESFASPFNATRLENTVNMVEELQGILSQWIDKYSQLIRLE